MLIKLGEATLISENNIQDTDEVISRADLHIHERMKKFAENLKTIAPHASDFLYFTAVMMHAAEASIIDDDGNVKTGSDGNPLSASWEKVGDSVRWKCSDPSIKPYKNANADIFPEQELKLAYKKWIGRPLCLDHKSSSVDMVRGVIVDTYWDDARKRIIALCALDKKNYPDLARKVSSGYATNVSMGVGVGTAICTEDGCHRAAKIASQFCDHMKNKSGYGEINTELNPIELSLVVIGADPKAKVKHIIAKDLSQAREAAIALQSYLDGKIALAAPDDGELTHIKEELDELNKKVEKLTSAFEADDADKNEAATESLKEPQEIEFDNKPAYSVPEQVASYSEAISDAKIKLSSLQETLNKLSNLSLANINEENEANMTEKKAYYQGTEEPTPGKPKYPVDPGQSARMQDKHMVGQRPFPDVGPVDGMYPGYDSFGETEEARKIRLQRLADATSREQIRKAAVEEAKRSLESKGYFQGTTEPTASGKPQYPADPLQEKARKEDKHMVGKKPFPDVGKVDGLYGDDLALKEKLSRAGLKASFKRALDDNGGLVKGASTWNVFAGDHLILTASVSEITRGNAETVYDAVATKDFGKSMIKKIVSDGFESARTHFKGAQAVAEELAAVPEMDIAPEADLAAPVEDEVVDEVKDDDAEVEGAIETAQSSLDKAMDLLEGGADVISEEASALDAASSEAPVVDDFAKSSVASMRKTLAGMLNDGFKEVIAHIEAHKHTLDMAGKVYRSKFASMKPEEKLYFINLINDEIGSSKNTLADSKALMTSFVSYAHGTQTALTKQGQFGNVERPDFKAEHVADVSDKNQRVPDNYNGSVFKGEYGDMPVTPKTEAVMPGDVKDEALVDDTNNAEVSVKPEDLTKLPADTKVTVEAASKGLDLNTKEGRAMYRAKLAQKNTQFSSMLGQAHSEGGHTLSGIDSSDAKIERIDEVSKAMNDLANLPPKVRKQAQEIARLVSEGKMSAGDVDSLVANGIDKDAVQYYKKYWAEAKDPESNEFAKLLTEEKKKAHAASELEKSTVKIKRAHELAYEMRDKGMIEVSQIPQQVDEIMSWNDEGFNSMKNVIAKQANVSRTSIPLSGLLGNDEVYLPAPGSIKTASTSDLVAQLEAHFAKGKY